MSSPKPACLLVTVKNGRCPGLVVSVVAKSRVSSAAARRSSAAWGPVPGLPKVWSVSMRGTVVGPGARARTRCAISVMLSVRKIGVNVDREVHAGMDDRELGRRIGYWRRRRKLTQAVFADRIGRSKSWVEKVERGERSAGRLSVLDEICQALQVDVAALIGEEPARRAHMCLDDGEVERIRSSLERYAFGGDGDRAADLGSLRGQLAHAWAAFEFADYQVMGRVLPDLLDAAQRAHAVLGSQES